MKTLILLLISSMAFGALSETRYDFSSHKERAISTSKDKKKVLIFLSPSCPCSQKQFDYINSLAKKFDNVEFIGFSSNKHISKDSALKYFDQFKINFPIFIDKDLKYANKFSAFKTPHVFLIDENEEVMYQGAVTNKRSPELSTKFYLNDVLTALKENKKLPYTLSKTLGCYIAR
ncbi:redoxin [Halobacteriovorax sp. BALOs_7]|uniref:redoxin family protein n=1 Tax=Halobacteriovorax sp. BALOs_7 TaxID=2109558 RepID=UPI000EA05BEB|nr:redoxin domain-containing protein [Halobacteriovorax sp. BALOs_7]AYF45587.1 redoxin [Halobacteriovorax sp. BALOs_7]